MISTSGSDSCSLTPAAVMPKLPVTLDTKGRVRTSKEQRRLILAEFERSGVSATQFARRTGLKYSTLAGWVHRYRANETAGATVTGALVGSGGGTRTAHARPCWSQLPGGARLEIREAGQVPLAAALVRALEKPC